MSRRRKSLPEEQDECNKKLQTMEKNVNTLIENDINRVKSKQELEEIKQYIELIQSKLTTLKEECKRLKVQNTEQKILLLKTQLKTAYDNKIYEFKHKFEEENCFQWLEDLRVLFIESEDEQRATIPLDGPTTPHGSDKYQKNVKKLREQIKDLGLQLKGLDSKSISDICKGKKHGGRDEITFALYGKEDELVDFAKSKQGWVDGLKNKLQDQYEFGVKRAKEIAKKVGTYSSLFGSAYTLFSYVTGNGKEVVGLVAAIVGFAILATTAPRQYDRYSEEIKQELKKELEKVTKIKGIDVKFINLEDNYEFRVIIKRKSLLKEKVGALAKPTRRPTLKF